MSGNFFKNVKISSKLWGLTGILLLFLLILGGSSYLLITQIIHDSHEFAVEAKYNEKIIEIELGHLQWANEIEKLFVENKKNLTFNLTMSNVPLANFWQVMKLRSWQSYPQT
nr:hypothetical protein [uncultured Desulfobacter sp.]